jgi:hypothetical protein
VSAADLSRLAALFGSSPFTSAQALVALDAGLGQQPSLLAFGNALRAAAADLRAITYGETRVVLRRLGVTHSGARRWHFERIPPPPEPDSNEDLL